MRTQKMVDCLGRCPIISAIYDNLWQEALLSPTEVIVCQNANILTVKERIEEAHRLNKMLLVHIDLAEGIGRDRSGIEFLKYCGVDGIVTTRGQMVRLAKEFSLLTVQRLFLLDSHGVESMDGILNSATPDFVEIMPGVVTNAIECFSKGNTPVIAGGLIETKAEVTAAIGAGAVAISTGKKDLWYL